MYLKKLTPDTPSCHLPSSPVRMQQKQVLGGELAQAIAMADGSPQAPQ